MLDSNIVLTRARAFVAAAKAAATEGEKVQLMAQAIEAYTTLDTFVSDNGKLPTEWNHCRECSNHRRDFAPEGGHKDE